MKKILWILFVFLAILVGVYPIAYLFAPMDAGLLGTKTPALLQDVMWNIFFYMHIGTGAIALLVGWSQFNKKLRNRRLALHRTLGKTYVISVAVSGVSGLYISFFATGGIIAVAGFAGLALAWMFTTWRAYTAVLARQTDRHEHWMIRSYAVCFAAVTLRTWLPLMDFAMGMEFITAYRIVSWLCWLPNLVVAELIIRNLPEKKVAVRLVETAKE